MAVFIADIDDLYQDCSVESPGRKRAITMPESLFDRRLLDTAIPPSRQYDTPARRRQRRFHLKSHWHEPCAAFEEPHRV
jgi:hypothetical protein